MKECFPRNYNPTNGDVNNFGAGENKKVRGKRGTEKKRKKKIGEQNGNSIAKNRNPREKNEYLDAGYGFVSGQLGGDCYAHAIAGNAGESYGANRFLI